MIQAITQTNLKVFLATEDNRINKLVSTSQIRHLFKFTNDMDKSIVYVYAQNQSITNRFTEFGFVYNATPNTFTGLINFLPAGYWKYELFEVSWIGEVPVILDAIHAPSTETTVLPVSNANGVVEGRITKGKMYVGDASGTAQVQYTPYVEPITNNYIYYGQ